VLLLAMTGSNLASTVQGIFELFGSGGQLACGEFLALFSHLAQRDPELGTAMVGQQGTRRLPAAPAGLLLYMPAPKSLEASRCFANLRNPSCLLGFDRTAPRLPFIMSVS
jgi:hypothetical protein